MPSFPRKNDWSLSKRLPDRRKSLIFRLYEISLMTINRRTAIRQLAFLSASAALLPSCLGDRSKPDLVLNHFTVNGAGQRTLDALTATLIPTTDSPGARET